MAEEVNIKVNVEQGKTKTVKEVRSELEAAQKAAEGLGTSLGNTVAGAETKTVSLKAQLRAMKQELLGLDEGSAEFKKISRDAADLEDRIGDVSNRVKALASDTKRIDTLVGIGTGIAAGFQAASGAAALFGADQKKVEEAIKNVIAIQGIMNGVQTIANLLQKDQIVGIYARIALEKTQIALTKAWTAAQWALNAAMAANPIVLIGAAVAALATGIYFLIKGLKDGSIAFEDLGKWIIYAMNPLAALYELYKKFWSDEAKANKEREKQQKIRDDQHKAEIQAIKDKRAAESEAFKERQTAFDLTIARMDAEGKNSNKLKLQKLQDAVDETKAVLKANEDIIASVVKRYETEAALRGMSREQFLKSIGIDASIVEKQLTDQLQTQKDAIFAAETNLIALKTQMREKNNQDATKKQDELDALAQKAYEAELDRMHSLQEQRNQILDQIFAAENAFQDSMLTAQQREANAVRDKYFALIESAEQFGIDSATLKEAQESELLAIEQKYLDLEFDALEAQIDKENELKAKQAEEDKARREKQIEDTISEAEKVLSIVDSINSIAHTKELARIKAKQEAGQALTASEIKRLKNQEKVQKAQAIAQIAIDTARGVAAAVAAGAGVPFPGNLLAILSGVAAVLSGIKQANEILNAPSAITAGTSSGDISAGINSVGNQEPNVNAIQSGSTFLNPEPQKIYVVESEITDVQKTVKGIVSEATF